MLKVDTKIANWMAAMNFSDVEKDARWKAPNVNYDLMNSVFEKNNMGTMINIHLEHANKAINDFVKNVKATSSLDLGTAADEIKTAEQEAKQKISAEKTTINDYIEKTYQTKEIAKTDRSMKAISINKAKDWFNSATKGEGITGIVKGAKEAENNLKNIESTIQSYTAEDPGINKLAMSAFNNIVSEYTGFTSKITTTLASAQARAYADLRKFCLAAVALKKKMLNGGMKTKEEKETPEVKAAKEAFELESWAICEASDEYVFSTLELI